MSPRSIQHRPPDTMGQLLLQNLLVPPGYDRDLSSDYQATFLPSPSSTYLGAQRNRPTIDYRTQVKPLLEPVDDKKRLSLLDQLRDRIDEACRRRRERSVPAGQQREMGTVMDLGETRRLMHGVVTNGETGMKGLLFPGEEEELEEGPVDEELERLKGKVHGAVSNSDPSGSRTLQALRYERCDGGKVDDLKERKILRRVPERIEKAKRKPSNLIVNQDINEDFLKAQEALGYLRSVRSRLVKRNKSAVDVCRKYAVIPGNINDAVDLLSTISSVPIQVAKLEPLVQLLNINSENLDRFWDLFDHQIQLSTFKIGSFIKPFDDLQLKEELSRSKEDKHEQYHQAVQNRLKLQKFKDFDTAADLISPKPGTPFGLSHVDYFLPRTKEEIKTIFRNFDLPEAAFEDAWKTARKRETCHMNKVSAENFKDILHEQNIRLK